MGSGSTVETSFVLPVASVAVTVSTYVKAIVLLKTIAQIQAVLHRNCLRLETVSDAAQRRCERRRR
jgi:hypothetical protein